MATLFEYARLPIEARPKSQTLVAVIRKIDTQRMEPVPRAVTFYFDATGKLISYDLQRILNAPFQ